MVYNLRKCNVKTFFQVFHTSFIHWFFSDITGVRNKGDLRGKTVKEGKKGKTEGRERVKEDLLETETTSQVSKFLCQPNQIRYLFSLT